MIWSVRVLGVEVLRVEQVDDDQSERGDATVGHVVGFAPAVVEVREAVPDRE